MYCCTACLCKSRPFGDGGGRKLILFLITAAGKEHCSWGNGRSCHDLSDKARVGLGRGKGLRPRCRLCLPVEVLFALVLINPGGGADKAVEDKKVDFSTRVPAIVKRKAESVY